MIRQRIQNLEKWSHIVLLYSRTEKTGHASNKTNDKRSKRSSLSIS